MSPTRFMMVNPMWFTNSKNSVNRCKSVSKILLPLLFLLILSKNSVQERKSIILKLFMQNEPNFPNTLITLTPVIIKACRNVHPLAHPKNEPNTNPIKANSPNAKNEHNPIYNKRLHKYTPVSAQKKQTQFKPKTNPIFLRIFRVLRGAFLFLSFYFTFSTLVLHFPL